MLPCLRPLLEVTHQWEVVLLVLRLLPLLLSLLPLNHQVSLAAALASLFSVRRFAHALLLFLLFVDVWIVTGGAAAPPVVVNIPRSAVPFNEFEGNKALLVSTFPHLFPTGAAPNFKPPSVSPPQSATAICSVSECVSAAVKNNAEAFTIFRPFASDPEAETKLEEAAANPALPASKKLMSQLNKSVSIFARGVPFSEQARVGMLIEHICLLRHFGFPSSTTRLPPTRPATWVLCVAPSRW